MRIVKTIPDIQKVLNELLDFKSQITTKDLDLTGRRVRNANTSLDANDYVTRKELPPPFPSIPTIPNREFTVVFDEEFEVLTDAVIPVYVFGIDRESAPLEVWMNAQVAPNTDDLVVNIQLYQKNPLGDDIDPFNILDEDLTISQDAEGSDLFVRTSTLVTPPPRFGRYSKIQPVIVSGGGAQCVSIGVVCRRIS